jgi:TonB-dependent starch-binding outer membrane protein SusC
MEEHAMRSGFLLGALALAIASPAFGQNTGIIAGRVTERQTERPLANVQVRILGSNRGAVTDDSGSYRVVNVPAGQAQIAILRLGYGPQSRAVTVPPAGSVTADFRMAVAVATLDAITITATGQTERKRENGAPTAMIDSGSLNKAAISTLSDALSSRVAGVVVQTSAGETGAGSRIRIRGSNSISLSNDPLLIIDGIRADNSSESTAQGTGGQLPSRFNDINPEEIEDVEIIKGPAAAALYGTAAANGVIQITTKKGRAGRTRWDAFAETGTLKDVNDYPLNLRAYGHTAANTLVTNCNLARRTSGLSTACVGVDSTVSNNPIGAAGILSSGNRKLTGLSVAGGSDLATYFVSGEYQREQNVIAINALQRLNLRANMRSQLTKALDLQLTVGYVNSDLRRPQNDNNSFGVVSGSLLGRAADCSSTGAKLHPALCSNGNDTLSHGYFNPGLDPNDFFNINTRQAVQRLTSGLTSNWTPLNWIAVNATVGADINHRNDNETLPPSVLNVDQDHTDGYRSIERAIIRNYTSSVNASATYDYSPQLKFVSTVGAQYTDEGFTRTDAFGAKLLAGTNSLAGTTARFAVSETSTDVKTLGFLARQQVGWSDKVFVTAGVRTDRNSAFGVNYKRVLYPSLSTSWVVSDNGGFARVPQLSSLRLRAAIGSSGQNPGFLTAEQFYNPVAVALNGTDVPAFTLGGVGNPNLKPEKSTEAEGGFDMGVFDDKLTLEYTHYHKTTRDALVNVKLAPSLGSSTNRFQNLGRVRNSGDEVVLRALIWNTNRVKADLRINGSWTKNRLLELGVDENGVEIPQFTTGFDDTQIFKTGLPLGAYYVRPISSVNDADKNGLIACPGGPGSNGCEYTIADSASFQGIPFPKVELNFTPSVELGNIVRLSATLDHRGGQKIYNLTGVYRNAIFLNGAAVQAPTSGNLDAQAAALAAAATNGTTGGYIEDASFTKLREVALSFALPQQLVSRARASSGRLTLAGRNLYTWTKYSGLDPEVNANAQANFSTADFLTAPQVRYFTARLALSF